MNDKSQFERVKPYGLNRGDAVNVPWVILLSDWVPANTPQLKQCIEKAFADSQSQLVTIFIIDNIYDRDEDHWELLTNLTDAGVIVLESESDSDRDTIQKDPFSFVLKQLAVVLQGGLNTRSGLLPEPSTPEGYIKLGKAFTRLTPEELKDVIEGRRSDDWRYEI